MAMDMENSSAPFSLPPDGEVFTNDVLSRSENLIDAGIWEGLGSIQLRTWLRNFDGPEERYFAAGVLDALIYRSTNQTIAMMDHLFDRTLPDLIRLSPPASGTSSAWKTLLQARLDPGIRIVPVIRDNDPPTKSGPLIARYYRRHLGLNDRWMIWPWQLEDALKKGVTAVLFIDDFLGTGTQFLRFTEFFKLQNLLENAYAIYAPLVAHKEGITAVGKKLPTLKICAVEILDQRYGLFEPTSLYFQDGTNSPAAVGKFYDDLLAKRLPDVRDKFREGMGKLQLAYAFNHAIPNNCLPILWVKTDKWNPLFER